MTYVIGVDVGGTFTDAVLDDDSGSVIAAKAPSTPPDYSRGVLDVLEVLAEQLGRSVEEMLADTHHVAHGTTSSLNALVMRKVPDVGFLTRSRSPSGSTATATSSSRSTRTRSAAGSRRCAPTASAPSPSRCCGRSATPSTNAVSARSSARSTRTSTLRSPARSARASASSPATPRRS